MFFVQKMFSKTTSFILSIFALTVYLASSIGLPVTHPGCKQYTSSIISYSFYGPTQKVREIDTIAKNSTYKMYMAKNEGEYCQIAVRKKQDCPLQITLSDFTNENGDTIKTELLREYSVTTANGLLGKYPDPIVPCSNNTAVIEKSDCERNILFVILASTTKDTAPGTYTATVSAFDPKKPEDKNRTFTAEVLLQVWDFTLSDTPASETAIGMSNALIADNHGIARSSEAANEMYKKYYDFMLEHHISCYNLPYDILDERADAYMSDPRVTSFCIPYGTDSEIRAYYEKLSTNSEWLAKAYFYPIDEPSNKEAIEKYNDMCDRLSELYPGYNMVTPFYRNSLEDTDGENIYIQEGKSNIVCPNSPLFTEEKNFASKVKARQDAGDKVWWYVCCGPDISTGMCNIFVQQQILQHRVLFWQQKQYGVDGFLYWNSTYWCDTLDKNGTPSNVWDSAWTTPWTGDDTYGDGVLLYYGSRVGINGPVSSLRLEAVRDGLEDYAYLTMAEEIIGKTATDSLIKKITNDLTDYTYSDKNFENVRIQLGNAIESNGESMQKGPVC